ncbi:hypothetical protein GCM10027189_00430 [Rufibacter soli]
MATSLNAEAQTIKVTAVTPNPVCAGSVVNIAFDAVNHNGGGNTTSHFSETSSFQVYVSAAGGAAPYTLVGLLGNRTSTNGFAVGSGGYVNKLNGTITLPSNLSGTYTIAINSDNPASTNTLAQSASPLLTVYGTTAAPTNPTNRSFTYGEASPNKTLQVTVPAGYTVNWYSDATGSNRVATNSTSFLVNQTTAGTFTYYAEAINELGCVSGTRTSASLTINKRLLTISSPAAVAKTYDGTNAATITGTLQNALTGDDIAFIGTGTFGSVNVGIGISCTSTCTLKGDAKDNYTLVQPTGLSAAINPKSLTLTAIGIDKEYDGSRIAAVTLSSDKYPADNLSVVYSVAEFSDKNAGSNKTININGISLRNNDLGNYTLAGTTVPRASAAITPKGIVGFFTAKDKEFNGTTAAEVVTRSVAGQLEGDNVSLFGGTATFDTPEVGNNKIVTLSGASLSGNDAGNYFLNSIATATAAITAPVVPLPVSLISFSGKQTDGSVKLSWSTASEKDNEYFQVERSKDGKSFHAIGKVAGHGTSSLRLDYSFVDPASVSGTIYYRLKQVDYDKKFEYSKVIAVKVIGQKEVQATLVVYPNPTAGNVSVMASSDLSGEAFLTLFHSSGKAVLKKSVQVEAGQPVNLSLENLSAGVYYLQIQTATGKATTRVVKQ